MSSLPKGRISNARIALVTGAAQGIGQAIALSLAVGLPIQLVRKAPNSRSPLKRLGRKEVCASSMVSFPADLVGRCGATVKSEQIGGQPQ